MNIKLTAFLLLFFTKTSFTQISLAKGGAISAKEYSKEISIHRGKIFIITDIIGKNAATTEFTIDALAASNSGELTTLAYKCESIHKEGLILGFYGDKWNEAGVIYQAYGFKDLPIDDAREFIDRIEKVADSAYKFLSSDNDNANIYFSFKDIGVLMYHLFNGMRLRISWNDFDSEWQWSEFAKTERRFNKKMK
jgi:hypothetical protein